ncbi:MAG: 4-(cytidine 5'-diphospho)-2-C-methyl-D-erythritol kinase [Victivallales bacterium]|nr:4-(cytidine 5'-diphospho)-2-C-methyl-D-erythritol kinase [Victivallales bacterium]
MNTCAKINLYLNIIGKREDGYHELETVFWPLPWLYDTVEVSHADNGISMEIHGADLEADSGNLCWKAAQAFIDAIGLPISPHIVLTKRIPIAAGLGGGSSDAAATLIELNRICGFPLDRRGLHILATSLGADVPFFLNPVPSLATGIGEKLSTLPFSPTISNLDIILANPGFPIPASWAYGHWRENHIESQASLDTLLRAMESGDTITIRQNILNDLEHCIFAKFPVLKMIQSKMEELGITDVHISGSGPTLFGFPTDSTPTNATNILEETFSSFLKCFRGAKQ